MKAVKLHINIVLFDKKLTSVNKYFTEPTK